MAVQRNLAIDLVDQVTVHLTPDVIRRVAGELGESSGATQTALAAVVPTLLAGLANMASTVGGAQGLTRLLDAGTYDGPAPSAGPGVLDVLFGGRRAEVVDHIARFAGIRTESASSLLALAAPLVLRVLGTQRASFGPSAPALSHLLGEQRGLLAGLMPPGLGALIGRPGPTSGLSSLAASATSRVRREMADAAGARRSWIAPLAVLGLLFVGVLAWLTWPGAPGRPTVATIWALQLPGGNSILVTEGSFNFSVASWLASSDPRLPQRFTFEDLHFETGTTTLTPESASTVNNLVTVLKAYPGTVVTLEGHTDDTGDAAANHTLSLDRASAVKQLMVAGGVDESRITATGYGRDNPMVPNDTEQGRAKNRRLELVIVKR